MRCYGLSLAGKGVGKGHHLCTFPDEGWLLDKPLPCVFEQHIMGRPGDVLPGACSDRPCNCGWNATPKHHLEDKCAVCVVHFRTSLSFRILACWSKQNQSKSVEKQKWNFEANEAVLSLTNG